MPLFKEEYKKEEKINGVIYDMSPSPNYQHGIVNGNIYRIISGKLQGSICLAFIENLDYKYHPEINDDYVIPDVMIVCDRKYLKGGAYSGVPKFIVETLSPATALRDKTDKKEIYQEAGVEIYYLEDGSYKLNYSYILQDDPEEAHYNADTVITLKEFPNISMALTEIFADID